MIEEFLKKYKLPSYRAVQFYKHYYQEACDSFDQFTSFPEAIKENLKKEVELSSLSYVKSVDSKKKDTFKVLLKRKSDKKKIESVLMQHRDGRNTVCLSCMIGCPLGCDFCATGMMGFLANLTSEEIIDQLMYFKRLLARKKKNITNIVFMGMGEPLMNLDEVLKAVEIITDPQKIGMSQRRITISTAGYVPGLRKLIDSGYRGNLAISLHAPNQELRQKLMRPIASSFKLGELMEIVDEYANLTNKRVTYEYIMIKDVNDEPKYAYQLARLLKNRLAHVNLIPYNRVEGLNFERSLRSTVGNFASILEKEGIHFTVRVAMGDEVGAACGQLTSSKK